ncbi:MAG: flagellar basal-body rod protein FlgF [Alphaproteobacteria bacterium]|nr:flagellar basal-body rod protein FlgF [Alphaproteobacteria bacterium]
MENSLYIGLSRQMTLRTAMDLVSNNIANINTPGYRAQNPLFQEYVVDPKGQKDPLSFAYDYAQYDSTQPGTQTFTGNKFDVALDGPGFMGVQTVDGIRYTRAGNLTINNTGQLVTAAGFVVSAAGGGGAINIPTDAREIDITDTGQIIADGNAVGQIMVQEFDNLQSLSPEGNGLYNSAEGGRAATETKVKQGMIEGSNVNGVVEMTRMIEILRSYQSAQRLIQSEHDRQKDAVSRLGRVN